MGFVDVLFYAEEENLTPKKVEVKKKESLNPSTLFSRRRTSLQV